ncbi:MAG TPA: ABC transporter permease [Candidatus Acidoferrales bacterium]|nr:ABC transporter permease [Candidatus Acidoferrales bacterium]
MMMTQLANWFRRKKLESGLERELRYHLDRRITDLERSGLPTGEARRQALLELGGIAQIQEEVRDIWLTRWLRDFAYDLRLSTRSFLRTPSFSITAVLSLVLGIGATTAIYSLVDQVLLHALPVRQAERIVLIDWRGDQVANGFGSWNLMSYPICRDLDKQKHLFEGVFCRALTTVNLSTGDDYRPAIAEIVSGNYFPVLGVEPAVGRVLTHADDGTPNTKPVAVLSYDFWEKQLGGAPDVVGRKVLVNRHPMTIIGVAASTFKGIDVGEVPSIWIPASMSAQAIPGFNGLLDHRTRWMQVLGRLNQGVTLQEAEAGLQPWFKAMLQEDTRRAGFPIITPERRREFLNSSLVLTAAPQGHSALRRRLLEPLWVLFAVTAVLLGLACLNVSGLFLARGSARDREIATRLALGASRGRLGRQLLADSLLIALVGGLLGIAAAPIAVRTLIAFLPLGTAPTALHANVNSRLLLFAFVASVAAGLLSGLAPAWQAGRRSLVSSLRERGGTAFGGVRLRKVIVTAQIALTLTLVVGAALFVRTLDALMAKGPGFTTSSLISFGIDSLRSGYSPAEGNRLIRHIDEAIRQSPITQASAIARFALLTGGSWNDPMTILADKRISTDRDVNLNSVTPGFFQTMGIRIIAGRNFDERDARTPGEPGQRSAIVNEAFVKRYLGGRSPLGVRICEGSGPDAKPNTEIVGVMSNFSYRGLREESEQAYFPFFEGEGAGGTFYVRLRGTPESFFPSLRAIVHGVDPALPMTDFRTLNEQVDRSLNSEHMLATLSSSFGTLALLLSLVGLYGVMSFVVTQRTREIGIRLALGAMRWSAIWLVLRDALTMILSGIGIGLPFVWALGRLVESQLYDVKPADPAVIAITILLLCLAGLGAALIPAHRASCVNPTDALRVE